MKFRVIPSLLTNGVSLVKGTRFDNWRSVGSVKAAALVQAGRDVDELMLLDVTASAQKRTISRSLVADISKELRVPLTVGGGIQTIREMGLLLESGADKVVIGTASVEKPEVIAELSREFGSQAVVCAIDVTDDSLGAVASQCGTKIWQKSPIDLATELEELGCGELLVQNIARDGLMAGLDDSLLSQIVAAVGIPVIASSGVGGEKDVLAAAKAGCSAVALGALLQFTEMTPKTIKNYLSTNRVPIRA